MVIFDEKYPSHIIYTQIVYQMTPSSIFILIAFP